MKLTVKHMIKNQCRYHRKFSRNDAHGVAASNPHVQRAHVGTVVGGVAEGVVEKAMSKIAHLLAATRTEHFRARQKATKQQRI